MLWKHLARKQKLHVLKDWEIPPDEFKHFIGDDIRMDTVMLDKNMTIDELLSFYMGKNTPKRQEFIIDNLKVELDKIEAWTKRSNT